MAACTQIESVDEDVFRDLMDAACWQPSTIFVKSTGKKVSGTSMIRSNTCHPTPQAVDDLKLAAAVGDGLTCVDPRLRGDRLMFHNVKAIQYPSGGFVKQHADARHDDSHVGRLILIAPARLAGCRYTGGDLVTALGSHTQDADKWVAVFVPYTMPHSVSVVTSGCRCVLVCHVSMKDVDQYIPPALYNATGSESEDDTGDEY